MFECLQVLRRTQAVLTRGAISSGNVREISSRQGPELLQPTSFSWKLFPLQEPDVEILGEMVEAVQLIIDTVAPELLTPEQLTVCFERLQKILEQSSGRRSERLQRVQNEDFDEEEAEALEVKSVLMISFNCRIAERSKRSVKKREAWFKGVLHSSSSLLLLLPPFRNLQGKLSKPAKRVF